MVIAPSPPIWELVHLVVWVAGMLAAVCVIVWIEASEERRHRRLDVADLGSQLLFPLRKRDVRVHMEVPADKVP